MERANKKFSQIDVSVIWGREGGGAPSRISANIGGCDAFNSLVLRYIIKAAKIAAHVNQHMIERNVA